MSLGERVPNLRFPGFEGEWIPTLLKSILHERKTYAEKDGSYPHATLSKEGIYGKTDRYDRDFLVSTENKEYKITLKNDLCYNPANLKFGVICLNTFGSAIFSPIYVTFEIDKSYSPQFVGAALTQKDFIGYALRFQQGTVYERMAVSPEDFLSISRRFPAIAEQEKIAEFMSLLNSRIAAQRKLVELLKKHKRGLLDRIFERSKQTEKWKKYRLDQIAEINPSSESLPCEFFYIDLESVSDGVWHDKKVVKKESAPSRAQRVIQKNDILFQMVRPYQQNNLHITTSYDKPIVASTGYAQIRTSQNPSFIYWLLHSRTFLRKVLLRCTGSSYPAINSSDLKEIYVSIPPLEDQNQYARALDSILQKCNIEESLVCHLENLKSGLLQQMFV